MTQLHAQPYDLSATGFYFESVENFEAKAQANRNDYGQQVEEYELQFIDGDNYELFNALRINQANLQEWFETYEDMDDEDAAKVIYLFDHLGCTTYTANDIQDKLDDIYLFEGTAIEYAEQYLEETGMLNEIPQHLRYYFDTEAYARDMLLNGDIAAVEIMNTHYIAMGGWLKIALVLVWETL